MTVGTHALEGHLYCRDCIIVYMQRYPQAGCPTCHAPLRGSQNPPPSPSTPSNEDDLHPHSLIGDIYARTEADEFDDRVAAEAHR